MANRYALAAKRAADLTNKQFSDELSKLTPFSNEKLNVLLPKKTDKKAFAELMSLVESDAETDDQLDYLSRNLQTAGKVVFKILKYFI